MGFPVATRNAMLDMAISGTYYIALFTTAPDDEGSGGIEVSGGGYSRVAHSSWNTAAGGTKTNNGAISFGDPSADWGTVEAICLYDAASGGNFQGVTDSAISTTIQAGVTSVTIADGALIFTQG